MQWPLAPTGGGGGGAGFQFASNHNFGLSKSIARFYSDWIYHLQMHGGLGSSELSLIALCGTYMIVFVWWLPIHLGWNYWMNSKSCWISILKVVGKFGMLGHNYFSGAQCVPLVQWTFLANIRFPSAHSSPSA